MSRKRSAWTPCECGAFWCEIHDKHAFDCLCPPIEEWGDEDPYAPAREAARSTTPRT